MRKFGNVLWGLVFVILGLIFGLNAMGITDINIFFPGWWTLVIIIPSFIGLFRSPNKLWNIIWLMVGIVLLLSCLDILAFDMIGKLLFPAILVVIGISLIFKDSIHTKVNSKIKELNKDGLEEYCSTFGAQKVNLEGEEFKGASLDSVFGSVELDVRNANITEDKVINASAIFGGIDIWVPNNVNIKVKSTPIFGGVTNKAPIVKGENIPTIYVNAFCMFGGVEIK